MLVPVLSIWAVDPFRVSGRTNADRLRVRVEPTLTAETVGHLPADMELEITDVTAEEMIIGTMSARWYKVRNLPGSDPMEGWSYGFFIDLRPEELLALATWLGRPRLVRELIDGGVDVNAVLEEEGATFTQYDEYGYGTRPVIEAVRAGGLEILQMLLASGADPDAEYSYGEPGGGMRSNALVTAVELGNTGAVAALVEAGADLEAEKNSLGAGGDGYRATALSAAVESGNRPLVEYLVAAGADVNHAVRYRSGRDGDSWKTPLDIAEEKGFLEIAGIIRAHGGETAGSP